MYARHFRDDKQTPSTENSVHGGFSLTGIIILLSDLSLPYACLSVANISVSQIFTVLDVAVAFSCCAKMLSSAA